MWRCGGPSDGCAAQQSITINSGTLAAGTASTDLSTFCISGTPNLTVTAAQMNDSSVLGKISGAYNILLSDSSTNILANLDAINALVVSGKILSIKLFYFSKSKYLFINFVNVFLISCLQSLLTFK